MPRAYGRTKDAPTGRSRAVAGVMLAGALLIAGGCGSSESHPGAIKETLDDFEITSAATHVKPGSVTFEVINEGPSTHEFIVGRTDLPADKLPIDATNLKVDEEAPQVEAIDEVPGLLIGQKQYLTVKLAPGHYVLYCNLEGHYEETMHVALTVG